jgi:hypothetical protein
MCQACLLLPLAVAAGKPGMKEAVSLVSVEQLPSYRTRSAKQQRSETLPATSTGHYTTCCKNLSLALLKMGKSLPETC